MRYFLRLFTLSRLFWWQKQKTPSHNQSLADESSQEFLLRPTAARVCWFTPFLRLCYPALSRFPFSLFFSLLSSFFFQSFPQHSFSLSSSTQLLFTMSAVVTTSCPDLELIASGKVRDLYRIDASTLLFVATDRISAFDVIMDNGIPNKGKLLTEISIFWFSLLKDVLPNHFITANFDEFPAKVQPYRAQLEGRSMLVKSLRVLPIESIVRGYITGSAWSEYKKKGTVCDIELPKGMQESQAFPEPLWTPSTKAEIGDHDENIHPSKAAGIIGEKHAAEMARVSIELYTKARDYALERGIIIADTKFEFGVDENDTLYLIDEVLTPDSSRFWPAASYKLGAGQDSFDKQYLRNYLLDSGFDKNKDKGITLPEDVIVETMKKYQEAYKLLTGKDAQL